MISPTNGNLLLTYLSAQRSGSAIGSSGTQTTATITTSSAQTQAAAATTQAALQAAGGTHKATLARQALDKQQAALARDLKAAMTQAGVKLSGTIDFSVSSDGKVEIKGADADQTATRAFLAAETSSPSFATRIATQAKDALKLSATIQQTAAMSQAARYGGNASGVMSMYTSLMQQSTTTSAVFTLSSGGSSLVYPGSLTTKA